MARVAIQDVAKFYGAVEALKGVSVDVVDGEFLVLVGPSGCGKSTLLRMIAGLEEISAGEIIIGGKVVNDLSPRERNIAMVFQNYALYPHMTVGENMAFSLRLSGAPKAEIKEKVDRAAAILGLQDLLDRQPRQLSGASDSALQWGARSSAIRRSSSSTSRFRISTPSCGFRCAPRSRNYISGSEPRLFTSRMTRSRR
jgi:multiple sugar transport system ATP-binding protein